MFMRAQQEVIIQKMYRRYMKILNLHKRVKYQHHPFQRKQQPPNVLL